MAKVESAQWSKTPKVYHVHLRDRLAGLQGREHLLRRHERALLLHVLLRLLGRRLLLHLLGALTMYRCMLLLNSTIHRPTAKLHRRPSHPIRPCPRRPEQVGCYVNPSLRPRPPSRPRRPRCSSRPGHACRLSTCCTRPSSSLCPLQGGCCVFFPCCVLLVVLIVLVLVLL